VSGGHARAVISGGGNGHEGGTHHDDARAHGGHLNPAAAKAYDEAQHAEADGGHAVAGDHAGEAGKHDAAPLPEGEKHPTVGTVSDEDAVLDIVSSHHAHHEGGEDM